jgi:hypothetical protein
MFADVWVENHDWVVVFSWVRSHFNSSYRRIVLCFSPPQEPNPGLTGVDLVC